MEHRNKVNKLVEHHFHIDDAINFGIGKAVLLYNFRFWLDKNVANGKNMRTYSNGKKYYWTYNSEKALAILFPYLKANTIGKYLRELVEEKVLITNQFNKVGYDRTKWYTIPDLYEVKEEDDPNRETMDEDESLPGGQFYP